MGIAMSRQVGKKTRSWAAGWSNRGIEGARGCSRLFCIRTFCYSFDFIFIRTQALLCLRELIPKELYQGLSCRNLSCFTVCWMNLYSVFSDSSV